MTRRQIWGVADWLISEVERLGVDVRLNTYAEAGGCAGGKPRMR